MAHFAEIDNENKVIRVVVVPNEQEHRGEEFLRDDLQLGGRWIQTSFNNRIRRRYAAIGFVYDSENDVFIEPKPFPSWSLDSNFDWQAPVLRPENTNVIWDELRRGWFSPLGETEVAVLGD